MSRDLSARTPTTILRKRANKENDEKEGRRNKLRGRRVSFAPDEELETMHLYRKDKNHGRDDTDELLAGTAVPYGASGAALDVNTGMESPAPRLGDMAASPMLTPLSMDLTNNSQLHGAPAPSAPKMPGNQQSLAMGSGSQEFTRNITGCVPALSTLVEEDEDGMIEAGGPMHDNATESPAYCSQAHGVTPGGPSQGALLSPLSPFLLNEMRLGGGMGDGTPGAPEDTEELKQKWGFTPGAEDTLDASHGRRVMGDATYNNVYGNGTTGDITRSMKPLAGNGSAAGAGGVPLGALQWQKSNASLAAQAPALPQQQQQPPPEMTLRLLEEEEQHTAAWREPRYGAGHASVASNKVAPDSMHLGYNETTGILASPLPMGQPSAAPVTAGFTATAGVNYTAQLLADGTVTRHHALGTAMQHIMRSGGGAAPGSVQKASRRHDGGLMTLDPRPMPLDPTAASSSIIASDMYEDMLESPLVTAGGRMGSGLQSLTPIFDRSAVKASPAAAAAGGGFLVDQTYTLDDFALPPELPASQSSLPRGYSQQQPSQQPQQMWHAAAASQELSLPLWQQPSQQLQPYSSLGTASGTPMRQMSQPAAPPSEWPSLGRGIGGAGSQPSSMPDMHHMAPRQQLMAPPPARPTVPAISFPEFLQLVEVRFLDDMRRRTSIIHPAMGADLQQPNAASEAAMLGATQSAAELLDALHVVGPRAALSRRIIDELADKVEEVQTRVGRAEGTMARENPAVFSTVQLASNQDLDRLRDQMKLLKRVCRLRTMMSWKQQRIQFEQELGVAYRSSIQALQQEVEAMEVSLQHALKLEENVAGLQAQAARRAHMEEVRVKAALEQRQRKGVQLRQLHEVKAANELRGVRQQAAEERLAELKSRYETALQSKLVMNKQLQALRAEGVLQETPGKDKRQAASPLVETLLQRQEQLEVLQRLQGLHLDAREVTSRGSFELTFRNQFQIQVQLPPIGVAASAGCAVRVRLLPAQDSQSPCVEALLPHLESMCLHPLGAVTSTVAQLPAILSRAQVRLGHLSTKLAQLDALLLALPLFTRVQLQPGSPQVAQLQLVFIDAESCIRVAVSCPFLEALQQQPKRQRAEAGPAAACVEVEMPGCPAAATTLVAALEGAVATVLAGPAWLQGICLAVHAVLREAGRKFASGTTMSPAEAKYWGAVLSQVERKKGLDFMKW